MRSSSTRPSVLAESLEPRQMLAKTATLKITVYDDRNNNGHRDDGEVGVSDVHITARTDRYLSTEPTNSKGQTVIALDKAAKITVTVDTPYEYEPGQFSEKTITLRQGATTSLEFPLVGHEKSSALIVRLFRDRNEDGRRRGRGESYLGKGHKVSACIDDLSVATATSRADGTVKFTSLAKGRYTFRLEHVPLDIDDSPSRQLTTANAVTLADGERKTVELGIHLAPTVSGIAFRDRNHDGVRGRKEPLLRDAYVSLYQGYRSYAESIDVGVTGELNPLYHFVRTDSLGRYSLQLPYYDRSSGTPGDGYWVTAYTPNTSERVAPIQVDIAASGDLTVNLPFAKSLTTGTLTVQTFVDYNRDGLLNDGELVGTRANNGEYTPVLVPELTRIAKKHPDDRSSSLYGAAAMFFELQPGTYNLTLDDTGDFFSPLYRRITTMNPTRGQRFTIAAGESQTILIGVSSR